MDIFGSILFCAPQKGFLNLVLRKGKFFLKHTGLFTQRCMLQDLTGVNTRQISYPMLEQIMLSAPPGSSLCLQKQGYLPEEDPYSKHPYRLRSPCGLPYSSVSFPPIQPPTFTWGQEDTGGESRRNASHSICFLGEDSHLFPNKLRKFTYSFFVLFPGPC